MPGIIQDWPEGAFFGYDRIYAATDLGYRGPNFSFATMPDQYTLSAFERLERAPPDRRPLMAVIPLISSHAPWDPVPDLRRLGPRSATAPAYHTAPAPATRPTSCSTATPTRVRADYARAVEYSLSIAHLLCGDLRRRRPGARLARRPPAGPGRHRRRARAATRRSRSSPATRPCSTASDAWGWSDGLAPGSGPRSGGWTPSATASSPPSGRARVSR